MSGSTAQPAPHPFVEACYNLRGLTLALEGEVKKLHFHPVFEGIKTPPDSVPDFDEMHANLKLAYRHLEDARMRLGKAVQAFDGGTSVYPR